MFLDHNSSNQPRSITFSHERAFLNNPKSLRIKPTKASYGTLLILLVPVLLYYTNTFKSTVAIPITSTFIAATTNPPATAATAAATATTATKTAFTAATVTTATATLTSSD